jgi:hypothetical protein
MNTGMENRNGENMNDNMVINQRKNKVQYYSSCIWRVAPSIGETTRSLETQTPGFETHLCHL